MNLKSALFRDTSSEPIASTLRRMIGVSGQRIRGTAFLIVACIAAWLFCKPSVSVFPLDDAYIHLAYVRCFARSGHFCFNPGEPSLGTSSPLYVLLLSPFYRWGFDPYRTELTIGLLGTTATALFTRALARRAAAESRVPETVVDAAGLLAGLLVAFNGAIQWLAFSGMETPVLLAVTLCLVWSFARRGFDVVTGVVAGALFLVRAPGAIIGVVLVSIDLVGGRWRRCLPGAAVSAIIALPMLLVSHSVTGRFVPTTATGKLLTYVNGGYNLDEMLHFMGRFAELQKYTPVSYLLFALAIVAGVRWLLATRSTWPGLRALCSKCPTVLIVALWGGAHLSTYLWGFRTVGQQGRYLVEEQVVLAILGVVALAWLAPSFSHRRAPMILTGILASSAVGVLPLWRGYLQKNVEHVNATYLAMGRYIAESTPSSARIAAFDIGVARYVGDRYVIDLGGLLDPQAWPCLRVHECGGYARAHGATHFLYSREPEADRITGIARSELGRPELLRQTPIFETRYPDYSAPSLTHSLWLELTRVDGWFPRTDSGIRAAYVLPPSISQKEVRGVDLGDGLELVGSSLDTHQIRYMRGYPYGMTLTFDYRVYAQPAHPMWLHIGFFYVDPDDAEHVERVATVINVLISEGVVLPGHWPVGETVRIPQHLVVPYEAPGHDWKIRVAGSAVPYADERYPELETWTDVGDFHNSPSAMRPLAPL